MPISSEFALYLAAFLGPFIQEDVAIIGAVTAFLHPETTKAASGHVILAAMFSGLVLSDLWKYWIGFAGRRHAWAKGFAAKRAVVALGDKIVANPGKILMLARFIPGTRIPAYIAAGFFGVEFRRFSFWIIMSALAYTGIAVALMATVGMIAGEKGQFLVACGLIAGLVIWVGIKAVLRKASR